MSEVIEIGTTFDEFIFKLELGKVKELMAAIGDDNPAYISGEILPPTIPTIIDLWGGKTPYGQLLELNLEKVLYGGQKYEYLKNIKVGDEITVTTEVADIQTKKGMDFYTVKREYKNQQKETAIIGYTTIIERH
ncbi:FAS1-like dehydratase domain-containing protein [Psychrobacillus lasiicapitis]|uniref:MaoC family dehydratase n=1 Tax=Psychrobacillus lasiicapitis TaxID=1636719 RepID=A0A544T329_9BACI|nr:MaoC family dehydratase N-terminal domain-containing protein [Psychrobacillus lasiicapitis]TQR11838.1 MaoC family dehydratase [Psychrobacillus lasiicapitis]GGA19876.1 hypothetical protein GCM10011384_06510 [Psychrobacillus lasiicapitis]